jgi:NAD(P)H-dependent FMN reductase
MSRQITIEVDKKTGTAKVSASGYPGETCLNATRPFLEALGARHEPDEKTFEFYEQAQELAQVQQGQS